MRGVHSLVVDRKTLVALAERTSKHTGRVLSSQQHHLADCERELCLQASLGTAWLLRPVCHSSQRVTRACAAPLRDPRPV